LRYLGNKELIVSEIVETLKENNLIKKNLVFFDAFCGTGTVSNSVKNLFKEIIINDNLNWCVTHSAGRINSENSSFKELGFDPFSYLNNNKETLEGFFYHNYSPATSERMYFNPENAGRIDFFRSEIEKWKVEKKINDNEYNLLIHCLIESVSKVSNTAGVYGAFLKKWDPRALKPIIFLSAQKNEANSSKLNKYVGKIEDIISNVDCDVIYLDPPYTQNQYGTQYHLLETLVLNDNPSISKITGSRSTSAMRSDWSKDYKCHILFDHIISSTKAKYILFSYSTDGFMSKTFIESILLRYGKKDSYVCKKIDYKKYSNHKSSGKREHYEYLFFIEKKDNSDIFYESPLNYIGSKAKLVKQLSNYIPETNNVFFDVFGGGFNVGINSKSDKVIYNDANFFVKDLIMSFKNNDTYKYILFVKNIIKKFNLAAENKLSYNNLRDYYNSLPMEKRDPKLLYSMILYGFQQQIRFNSKHEFNNPCGMRWFNDKVLEKLISFSRVLKEKDVSFHSLNFEDVLNSDIDNLDDKCFFYMDPPYRLTLGSYNDGKRGFHGWDISLESGLLSLCDKLNKKGCKFMLSYVLEHDGKFNSELYDFACEKGYRIIELEETPGKKRKEVIIINYEKK